MAVADPSSVVLETRPVSELNEDDGTREALVKILTEQSREPEQELINTVVEPHSPIDHVSVEDITSIQDRFPALSQYLGHSLRIVPEIGDGTNQRLFEFLLEKSHINADWICKIENILSSNGFVPADARFFLLAQREKGLFTRPSLLVCSPNSEKALLVIFCCDVVPQIIEEKRR